MLGQRLTLLIKLSAALCMDEKARHGEYKQNRQRPPGAADQHRGKRHNADDRAEVPQYFIKADNEFCGWVFPDTDAEVPCFAVFDMAIGKPCPFCNDRRADLAFRRLPQSDFDKADQIFLHIFEQLHAEQKPEAQKNCAARLLAAGNAKRRIHKIRREQNRERGESRVDNDIQHAQRGKQRRKMKTEPQKIKQGIFAGLCIKRIGICRQRRLFFLHAPHPLVMAHRRAASSGKLCDFLLQRPCGIFVARCRKRRDFFALRR